MWRWYTAEDRRQAAAVGALLAIIGMVLVGCIAPTAAGLVIIISSGTSVVGSRGLGDWPMIIIGLWQRPGDPATAFAAAHLSPVAFWIVATVLIAGTGSAYAM